ncbi:MAG: hypothetical protein HDKAJFGB_03896 [Anaerolineae bacterium]|nr:hypothetical protein [Anaerolineae bacterium]
MRDVQTFRAAVVARAAHPFADFVGERDAGNFVVQKFRVARTGKRQHARENRQFQFAVLGRVAFQKFARSARFINRLRQAKVRTRLDFFAERFDFARRVARAKIARDACGERTGRADGRSRVINAFVEMLFDEFHQTRRHNVIRVRRLRIIARRGRVAHARKNVSHAQRVRRHQIAMHAQ